MKIGIDIRALQWDHRYRGIGVYLACLLEALSKLDHQNHYLLYAWHKPDPLAGLDIGPYFHHTVISIGAKPQKLLVDRLKNRQRRQIHLKDREVDVFLQPDIGYGLARGKVAQVAVVYDLIQMLFRNQHFPRSVLKLIRHGGFKHLLGNKLSWHLYKWSLSQLPHADAIISISNATKKDLLAYNPNLEARNIYVTHLAAGPVFTPSQQTRPTLLEHGISKPFLFYVGAADYRKNIIDLVEAFNNIKQHYDIQLVLAGKAFEKTELLTTPKLKAAFENSRYQSDIKLLGYVSQQEIRDLYSAARALVFPSIYEGFGMPVLEAMACGCPVVAYRTSAITETAGKAALLVPTGQSLTEPITRLLKEPSFRQRLIKLGKLQVAKFSWQTTAKKTLSVLNKVGNK